MNHEITTTTWYHTLLATFLVIGTVLAALWLSQFDRLQTRWQPTPIPIIAQITDVPLPITPTVTTTAVSLPSTTATSPPPTSTPSPEIGLSPSATAVAVLPSCGVVPAGWVAYIVQPGDSLFYLAVNSGATVDEITQANCLNMNSLVSGMTVYLPARPPVRVACGPPGWWVLYQVQSGDTMYSLATRHNTTVYAIMNANCLGSSYLVAGRRIYLPPAPVVPTATFVPTNTPIPPTPIPPTATAVPPTATLTPTPQIPTPTWTATAVPPSPTFTFTLTPQAPTATWTATAVPPSPTFTTTPIPATATFTPTPQAPTATWTATAVPPSPTFTVTPIPPTATLTPTPQAPTATAVPPSPTSTATAVSKP